MGNFTYENQGASTWLVYTLSEDEVIDSMSLGMITNNVIPGLCSTVFMQKNANRYIKYNISSRIPVNQFFSGPVNRKKLLGVFDGVIRAVTAAEEYMIDADMILLDLNYIYADVSTCDTVLICLPVAESGQQKYDIGMFFKEIMFSTLSDPTENCDHVTKIINYLNSAYRFSLTDFQSLIRELGTEGKADSALPGKSDETISRSSSFPAPPVYSGPMPLNPAPVPPPSPYPNPIPVSPDSGRRDASGSDMPSPVLPSAAETEKEKGMSLFYLLRHYDKENAGIYKAQKEAKKQQKESKKKEKKEKPGKEKQIKGSGFVIPGQMAPPIPPQSPGSSILPAVSGPSFIPPVSRAENPGADFGATVFLGQEADDSSETVIMGGGANAEPQICPHLIRRKNNERIPIQQDVFRLGRNADFNNYVITGNEFVGNTHCHILVKGGEYFIVDDNSKNHTFVDGVMVMPGTEVKLMHGQTVTLADEEFEFRLF